MKYRFRTVPAFRRSFRKLSPDQVHSATRAFQIFRNNPFDPRLRTHKIHRLSAFYKKTVYAVWIEGDLRSVFYLDGTDVVSIDVGTHAIYRS